MSDDVSFAKLDPDAHEERFRRLRRDLGVTSFGINLLVMEPGQRSRIHRHEHQEEVYLPLRGELTLLIEGDEEHTLGTGDLARVGARRPPPAGQPRHASGSSCWRSAATASTRAATGRPTRAWDEEGAGRAPVDVPFPRGRDDPLTDELARLGERLRAPRGRAS